MGYFPKPTLEEKIIGNLILLVMIFFLFYGIYKAFTKPDVEEICFEYSKQTGKCINKGIKYKNQIYIKKP